MCSDLDAPQETEARSAARTSQCAPPLSFGAVRTLNNNSNTRYNMCVNNNYSMNDNSSVIVTVVVLVVVMI